MTIQTRYITADDYKDFFGKDLASELAVNDNPSNEANAFIMRTEVEIETMLNCFYGKNITALYPHLNDIQKQHYQLALLYQVNYKLINGDIINDSGYDFENGDRANAETILSKSLAPMARMQLELSGLLNRHIGNGRGGVKFPWQLM